jgi:hypothetical protein
MHLIYMENFDISRREGKNGPRSTNGRHQFVDLHRIGMVSNFYF